MSNNKRIFKIKTGKQGAINVHLMLTRQLCYMLGMSGKDIEDKLNKERKQLESTLKEGVYQISSEINDDYITYII